MKISMISFTNTGLATEKKLEKAFSEKGYEVESRVKSRYTVNTGIETLEGSLNKWTEHAFEESDALVFISAAGIAVRSIAPFVSSKNTDPAVVVLDERGKFVISLLSGHIGGANEFTEEISGITGGIPVITTATDVNEKFAVDVFAEKNGCRISDMTLAKYISAAVVNGERVSFRSDFPCTGKCPEELDMSEDGNHEFSIHVTCTPGSDSNTLYIIPKAVTAGIGCRRGTPAELIEKSVEEACRLADISPYSIEKICSIDLKKDEPGLQQFAADHDLSFVTFTAEELNAVEGEFSFSAFVEQVTGVDNVCERSAVLGSSSGEGTGNLITKKYAGNSVTVAFAGKKRSVSFE